jgi:O-antigen/teichoic acid export membrane protein
MTEKRPPNAQEPASLASRELERRILGNTGWVALGHGGRQLATFVALLVLARLLEPRDFGLVALAWAVLAFVEQIQETGIGQALIHRRDDIERAAASAVIFSPSLSLMLYAGVFAASPVLAELLRSPDLVEVLRVMALVLVLRGLAVVPGAILERDLDFRSRTVAEIGATLAQVGVSIGLAVSGAGVWSLVLGHLSGGAVQTALYWLLVPWRPSPRAADIRILRELMRYGRYIGAFNVLTVVSNTVDDLVVGRVLGTAPLGVYSVVYRVASSPATVLGHIVGRPMFSVYSMLQGDLGAFRYAYVRNLQRVALIAVPASVGLAVAAEPVVRALLGEQWLTGVTALHILAVYGLFKIFGGLTSEAMKGLGRSGWNLGVGILYAVVVVPALVILTPRYGITGASVAMLIAVSVSALTSLGLTWRALHLRVRDVAGALAPSLLCSAVLAVALAALLRPSSSLSPAASLALLVSVGLVVYVAATIVFARSIVMSMWLSLGTGRRQSPSPDDAASEPDRLGS